MHDKIKALQKENNELRKTIESLEQEEADFLADDEAERTRLMDTHNTEKQTMKDEIARTKVELDKLMSTKLII